MYAIISEIDQEASKKINQIWTELYKSCGLESIYTIAIPHFTWLVSDNLDLLKVKAHMAKMLPEINAIQSHTFGLGIFSGKTPVLFLPMVKSIDMIQLHQRIWDDIQPHCKDINLYYSPPLWLPHITIALNDLNRETLACAVNQIAFEPLELSITMTNLAITIRDEGEVGNILERYPVEV